MYILRIIIVKLLLLIFISCAAEESTLTKNVESLIQANNSYIQKAIPELNESVVKQGFLVGKDIIKGNCPTSIDEKHIPYILDVIVLINSNIPMAKKAFKCLLVNGFERERHYHILIDFVRLWDDRPIVALMYHEFFENYVPPERNIFGLIEFAKYYRGEDAVTYLRNTNYPENANNLMNESEYKVFDQRVSDRCRKVSVK